jgi:multidrug efflux pump subunit AcrB
MVKNYQIYAGTSAPISFNGLVRHYDIRRGENVADIQVNLIDKKDRKKQSHDIAKEMRKPIQLIAQKYQANVKIVEVPPGPPVLSTLVAEIYGPDYDEQIKIAQQVKQLLANTKDVVDIDWMIEDDQAEYQIEVDKEKAIQYGVATAQIAATVRSALTGLQSGNMYHSNAYQQTPIKLQLSDADKTSINDILEVK